MGEAGLGGWVGVSNAVFSTASVLCRIPRYSRGRHFVHLTLPVFNFGEKRKKKTALFAFVFVIHWSC